MTDQSQFDDRAITPAKHGLFTRGAIEQRKQVQALIGQSRKLLQDIE